MTRQTPLRTAHSCQISPQWPPSASSLSFWGPPSAVTTTSKSAFPISNEKVERVLKMRFSHCLTTESGCSCGTMRPAALESQPHHSWEDLSSHSLHIPHRPEGQGCPRTHNWKKQFPIPPGAQPVSSSSLLEAPLPACPSGS